MKVVYDITTTIIGDQAKEAANWLYDQEQFLNHIPGLSSEEYIDAIIRLKKEMREKFGVTTE